MSKKSFRVVVEVLVDAEDMEAAKAEALRKLRLGTDFIDKVEVKEVMEDPLKTKEQKIQEDKSVKMLTNNDLDINVQDILDGEIQPVFNVTIEFTLEEAKHLYNLMRLVYGNLQRDPDYHADMVEAKTISKVIDALEDSLGEIIHANI